MSNLERYWTQVRLTMRGDRQIVEIASAKTFLKDQLLEQEPDAPNAVIQRYLMQVMQDKLNPEAATLAESCLRCFVSHQIDLVCANLATNFGGRAGFGRHDLLVLVMDDVATDRQGQLIPFGLTEPASGYHPFASKIVQSFDPAKAELSTWTRRKVVSHPDVNQFLLSCGVRLMSDWALLNDNRLTAQRLAKLLSGVYNLPTTAPAVQSACELLEAFHTVYRRDRLSQKRGGSRVRCLPPTPQQLTEIASYLSPESATARPCDAVLKMLKDLAQVVRHAYFPKMVSINQSEMPDQLDYEIARNSGALSRPELEEGDTYRRMQTFLKDYRQVFQTCLEEALHHSIHSQLEYHRQRRKPTDAAFLKALCLFYCQQIAMGKIAPLVELKQQFQVARLLNLKSLRATVRHRMLQSLGDRLHELVQTDAGLVTRLHTLDQQLEELLGQEIDKILEADQAANYGKRTPSSAPPNLTDPCIPSSTPKTIFADRLCNYLHPYSE
ncbi:hypothetical protein ACQ4M4_14640 [Leptolyngbya sp. AN02str]|uniref:hypothetical protein n=1 Tax=Leptolyngbya sp. AN02str TaxID=3423363 RepID=UPI003D322601